MTLVSRSCPTCHSVGTPQVVDVIMGEPATCADPWHSPTGPDEGPEPPTAHGPPDALVAELRDRRIELRISQARLGDLVGVTQTAISYWESGKRTPSSADLLLIARALGCGVEINPGSRRVLVLGGCHHWWIEHRPAKVRFTSPRVCSQCQPGDPGVVGPSPQGLGMVEVQYLTEWTERALDAGT